MKKYKDLLSELPSKSVIITYGQFNPPSTGHELLIKVVRKLAKQRNADHVVFVSTFQDKKNPLEISKKIQYLELLFPNTKFIAATNDLDCIGSLHKYKNVVMVTSADSVNAYTKLLKRGKFETTEIVTAGSKCPDSDDKLMKLANKGDYLNFKNSLPTTIRELDAKRLMNDIRIGLDLEPIKEQINLVKDELREQYFRGEIFKEGDIVECDESVYKIVKRGSNHLLLQSESGLKVSKWIKDVKLTERQFMLDQKLLKEADATSATGHVSTSNKAIEKAKQDSEEARLAAKHAEEKAKMIDSQKKQMDNLKSNLQKEDSPVVNTKSKYNIAKSLMSLHDFRKTMGMGVKGVDQEAMDDKATESDLDASIHATKAPQHAVTGGQHMDAGKDESLRRMRVKYHLGEETKEEQADRKAQLKRFGDQSKSVNVDKVHAAGQEPHEEKFENFKEETIAEGKMSQIHADIDDHLGKHLTDYKNNGGAEHFAGKVDKTADHISKLHGIEKKHATSLVNQYVDSNLKEEFDDINEEELVSLVEVDLDNLSEEDFYEAYEDDELAIIDDETGEEIEAVAEEAELDGPALMEVLSRMERIKAKARMRRSQAKRQRREKVALRQLSTPQVANRRARRMAVSALKKRLLRGQNPSKVSVGQKERIERFIQQRRKIVDRLATRMVSRVKQVEKARMAHKKFTRPNNGVSF